MNPDDRVQNSNSTGDYNLKFVDWTNEWERLAEEGMPSWYEDSDEGDIGEGFNTTIKIIKQIYRRYGISARSYFSRFEHRAFRKKLHEKTKNDENGKFEKNLFYLHRVLRQRPNYIQIAMWPYFSYRVFGSMV